jgi:hypothetical protein
VIEVVVLGQVARVKPRGVGQPRRRLQLDETVLTPLGVHELEDFLLGSRVDRCRCRPSAARRRRHW